MTAPSPAETAQDVLAFWFEETKPEAWFKKEDSFDARVRARFESLAQARAEEVRRQGASPWQEGADTALALLLLLDQFPRNMYRGTARAFAWDDLALRVAGTALEKGYDLLTPQDRRAFFYMPFMHSEDLSDQERCVALTTTRLDDQRTARHARAHREVIRRFGRFPHRNDILGRASTPAEIAYLAEGGYVP